jgi:uncharacterized protein (DUF4415 family)
MTPDKRPPGRPPLPPEDKTRPVSVRLNAAREAKLRALGPRWLERAIDRAKL